VIVAYIDSYRNRFGVEPICAVLTEHGIAIAPSTYYAHKAAPVSAAVFEDAYLANALYTLWVENWRVYGARKLWKAARRAKIDVGRDQVARLMRVAGIRGVVRGRHATVTTRRDDSAPRHPDLVKRAWDAPSALDELWVADFSYVWTLTRTDVRMRGMMPRWQAAWVRSEGPRSGCDRRTPGTGHSEAWTR